MASATVGLPALTSTAPLDPDALYEIIDGERREIPHMGAWAGTLASLLVVQLNAFAYPRKLGLAVVEVLFRLGPNGPSRRPDIAFIGYDRWPTMAAAVGDPPEWEFAPKLAVEVVSSSNTAAEVLDKIEDYFTAGVQLVWVIYPRHRQIYVYDSPTHNDILRESDELDGGTVVPGFRLKIADLFAALVKPA